MTNDDLEILNKVDEFVTGLNDKVKHPYFFSWSLPTNHKTSEPVSYFCIWIGKYLVQHTKNTTDRGQPILTTYFFGRLSDLEHVEIPENIATWWTENFSEIMKKNYTALDAIARGFKDQNYSEYNTHEYRDGVRAQF